VVTKKLQFSEDSCPLQLQVWSTSIRIGIVVFVHWMGCVCNQSCHVRTCLSNSWHKLQVAAFAQLAAVGRGSNTCIYVMAIFTMCESTEQGFCIKFMWRRAVSYEHCDMWRVLGLRVRPGNKTANVTVEGSHISATKEGAPSAKQNEGHGTGVFWFWGYCTPRVRSRRANN